MMKRVAPIFPREQQQARALGQRLRSARLRRGMALSEMAARAGVTPKTMRRLEQGDSSVGLALLVRTLSVLGLAQDLDRIAGQDEIGERLVEMGLRKRPHRKALGVD